MSAFRELYPCNFARIPEADAVEVWGITEEGESIDANDECANYFCVFIHVHGEGIIDLVDVETFEEAQEWAAAILAQLPS